MVSDPSYPNCGAQASLQFIAIKRGSSCGCTPNYGLPPYIFGHELGHAMGLRHHSASGLVGSTTCCCTMTPENVAFTAQEEFRAGILYSRPAGNTDPDTDPEGFQF